MNGLLSMSKYDKGRIRADFYFICVGFADLPGLMVGHQAHAHRGSDTRIHLLLAKRRCILPSEYLPKPCVQESAFP